MHKHACIFVRFETYSCSGFCEMNGVTYDVRAGSDIPAFTISPFLLTHTISSLDVVDRSNVAVALWWSIRRESEGVGFDEGLVRRLFYRYFLSTFTPRSC